MSVALLLLKMTQNHVTVASWLVFLGVFSLYTCRLYLKSPGNDIMELRCWLSLFKSFTISSHGADFALPCSVQKLETE
jgi:hypothetical protein